MGTKAMTTGIEAIACNASVKYHACNCLKSFSKGSLNKAYYFLVHFYSAQLSLYSNIHVHDVCQHIYFIYVRSHSYYCFKSTLKTQTYTVENKFIMILNLFLQSGCKQYNMYARDSDMAKALWKHWMQLPAYPWALPWCPFKGSRYKLLISIIEVPVGKSCIVEVNIFLLQVFLIILVFWL